MKKMWIYVAVPMTILNGCQNQAALVGTSAGTVAEETAVQEGEAQESSEGERQERQRESAQASQAGAPQESQENSRRIEEAAFSGSTVTIAKSREAQAVDITEAEIEEMVRTAASDLVSVVKDGQTVVLKPNLVQMIVDSTGEHLDREVNGITSDWRVTKAVLTMVRELNPDGKVYIMEGSATGSTRDVMEYFHYTPEYLEGVDGFICLEEDCGEWHDFHAPQVVKVELPDGLLHKSYYFNRILYEADVVISIPTLKTSSGVVVTGGIKNVSIGTPPGNLYGVAPDNPSKTAMVSHKITDGELDKWIYDYYMARPVNYVVVDGLQGFQSGPVPMSHERKETDKMNMGIIMGGKDAVAVDTVCSLISGWDPQSVGYLNMFRENTNLGETEQIRVKGAYVDELRKKFTIKKPELGGIPLEAGKGPDLTAEAVREGGHLEIYYKTDSDSSGSRVEILVDGSFQYSGKVSSEGKIGLQISGMSEGTHEVEVFIYDRYLNKTRLLLSV